MSLNTKRVAIVGGDERTSRLQWPKGLDIRFYKGETWGGNGSLKGLQAGLANGKFDAVVVLTRWIGHSMSVPTCNAALAAGCKLIRWDRGTGELARQLVELLKERKVA